MWYQICKVLVSPLFGIFLVLVLGYLLGRIKIKGISLGSAGVFIMAIVVGIVTTFIKEPLNTALLEAFGAKADGSALLSFSWGASTFSIVKNIGLALFVTSVGLIAGPKFFRNFKSKAVAYIVIGVVVILTGTIVCIMVAWLDPNVDAATATGLLMGSLTSTPGFSAAQNVFEDQATTVAAANGAAYPFGVIGVVLFVQLLPRLLRADIAKERELLVAQGAPKGGDIDEGGQEKTDKKLFTFDKFGLCVFAITVALGLLGGAISFKFSESIVFNLTSTGGCLLVGLLFGHFGKVGKVSLQVPDNTLKVLRELGLVLFLMGSGFEGGLKFLELVSSTPIVFLYGVLMTLIPMIVGFIIAKFMFKLCLLNNLGSITGGMTSTPALGSLIAVAETEDVASAYAATYPISLILLVFMPQLINVLGV
ncbi:MAG: hypothetical protein IKC35_00685 [Clostridia bacterium]|nr:hypothetical protein [Clostridia bacterium]